MNEETNHCVDCCCARSWKALGNPGYTGESIPEHIDKLKAQADALTIILTELRAEMDDYSDVIDNPEGGRPRPNVAMRLMQFLDEKLAEIKVLP
jgi:hypothetical protein